jgi:ABC-2 type transport system permease protein
VIKNWQKYITFFTLSFKQAWTHKTNLSGLLFFLFILLFIYNRLWEVIGLEENTIGLNSSYIWYLLLAEMIILSSPRIERILFDDIQSGTMAYYINKPVSFFLMRYFEALGNMSVSFVIMGLIGTLATLALTGKPPFAWHQFPFIILMCYLSSCINVLLCTGIGLCTLWLNSIRTLSMAFERLAFIFGGAIFPLSIYPEWFVDIAKWTPFYSFYYLTIKLVYDFSWINLSTALFLNLFWISLIMSFIYFVYGKLNQKVNIYGG